MPPSFLPITPFYNSFKNKLTEGFSQIIHNGIYASNISCSDYSSPENCTECSKHPECVWCQNKTECVERDVAYSKEYSCPSGLCDGDSCGYVCICTKLYPCSTSILGMLILMFFYGLILSYGAKLISDGAEGMLDLFPKYGTVIGALLLPGKKKKICFFSD